MKKCSACGIEKELSEFHRDKKSPDGHRRDCKECHIKEVGLWRAAHPDYSRPYTKKLKEYYASYRKQNPLKRKARDAVGNAIVAGKLVRQPCEKCGNIKSQAHHEDYNKPLDVIWLCRKCHMKLHRNLLLKVQHYRSSSYSKREAGPER